MSVTSTPTFQNKRNMHVRNAALWSPFAVLVKRINELVMEMVAASRLRPGARVLDYGCADTPYRTIFDDQISYVGADLAGNEHADLVLNADGTIPAEDGSFDLVLSTQVLEHVPDPDTYIAECFRVLRPGGTLALSTHGIMYYHRDPEDYWRWTRAGLGKLVGQHGFVPDGFYGVLGLAAAALQIFQDATYFRTPRILKRPYALVMQTLVRFADRFYSDEQRVENGLVLAVRAVKPS